MRAVMLEADQAYLEERRRRGLDGRDEMWEGELHLVPPPFDDHQGVTVELMLVLGPLAKARGLLPRFETGLFRPGVNDDYRVPDQTYARPELRTERGIDGGADLVVEIRSPHDETDRKVPWYLDLGVTEVLVVDPRRMTVELHRSGQPVAVSGDGEVRSEVLGVAFATVDGALNLTWEGGEATIPPPP